MASSCQGKGAPCPCPKFRKGKQGKGCQNCGHSKRRHKAILDAELSLPQSSQPRDTVSSILARQWKNHGGRPISDFENLKPSVSYKTALKEVLPAYHGGRAASSSRNAGGTLSASNSVSKKKKQTTKSVKFQQIGSLLFLLCGMWVDTDQYGSTKVELRSDKPLRGPEEEELRQNGVRLLIDEDAAGLPLQFSPDWSTQAIDKWLRGLAPKLFEYLDLTFGVRNGSDDQYHWRLVRQQNKRVFLFGKELVSGSDLGKCIGGQARKKETFRLHIATRHPIDKSIWTNFERAIKVAQKKPINVDFVDRIEQKPVMLHESSDEGSSSSEDGQYDMEAAMQEAMETDSSDDDVWRGLAAKPKTRSKTPLFDDEGDEEEMEASETAEAELNANGKRPRATSPLSPRRYNTHLAKRAKRTVPQSPGTEDEQAESQNGHGGFEQAGSSTIPTTAADMPGALFIDGVDFNVPDSPSPGPLAYYYSPAPPSPPPFTQAEPSGSTSHVEASTSRVIRDSPGRPSRMAWKKRNIST